MLESVECDFGMGYEPIEKGLRQYVLEGRFPTLEVPWNGSRREAMAQAEVVPRADLLTILGEYMHHVTPWHVGEARLHLEAAVQAGPTQARAHAALAGLMVAQGENVRADEVFRRAVELAGDDDEPYFRWGMSKVRRFLEQHGDDAELPKSLP